jgi:alkyl sulfatase BDS1-like metallo-beta-lactamase superfamily hydrolase
MPADRDGIATGGDTVLLGTVLSVLDQPDPNFAIVTP